MTYDLWHTLTDTYNIFHHLFNALRHSRADTFSCHTQPVDITASVSDALNVTVEFQSYINISTGLFSLWLPPPPPHPSPSPSHRKWQPDTTLQVSKVNAPEHCLCCAALRVKFSPHRCGDIQRGLNLIKPGLGRLPFVSCRGFHYHRRVYLPSASLICTRTKPACRHVFTGTDRNIQRRAAMYWHLQSILGTNVVLTWSFAMLFAHLILETSLIK